MQKCKLLLSAACLYLLAVSTVWSQDGGPKPKLNVLHGPAKAPLGAVAQIDVPVGCTFIDGPGTRALMKAYGEPVSGRELGSLMGPTNQHWSVVFEFSDIGYVKDDDKNILDNPDKLLAEIKEGTEIQNKERIRMNSSPLEIIGWEQPPKYDSVSHNLEWAIRATSEGQPLLNYNTRLLGRKGVMEVVLVVDPNDLAVVMPAFKTLLAGYSFQTGQSYSEYKSGDKVAKYGLAALVVGGAAVGAAKLGLFAWLAVFLKKGFKLVIVAVVAVIAFIKKTIARLFGGRSDDDKTRPPST